MYFFLSLFVILQHNWKVETWTSEVRKAREKTVFFALSRQLCIEFIIWKWNKTSFWRSVELIIIQTGSGECRAKDAGTQQEEQQEQLREDREPDQLHRQQYPQLPQYSAEQVQGCVLYGISNICWIIHIFILYWLVYVSFILASYQSKLLSPYVKKIINCPHLK